MYIAKIQKLHFGTLRSNFKDKGYILEEDVANTVGYKLRGVIINRIGKDNTTFEFAAEVDVKHMNFVDAQRRITEVLQKYIKDRNIKCSIDPILEYMYSGESMN